jgi:hypothetical protein
MKASLRRLPIEEPGMNLDRQALERRFHNEMVAVWQRARAEAGDTPVRVLQLVRGHGGLATARGRLRQSSASEGFAPLALRQRLDLTVEALALKDPWRQLVTAMEPARAEQRLSPTRPARRKEDT